METLTMHTNVHNFGNWLCHRQRSIIKPQRSNNPSHAVYLSQHPKLCCFICLFVSKAWMKRQVVRRRCVKWCTLNRVAYLPGSLMQLHSSIYRSCVPFFSVEEHYCWISPEMAICVSVSHSLLHWIQGENFVFLICLQGKWRILQHWSDGGFL